MSTEHSTAKELVGDYFFRRLKEKGWTFVSEDNLKRGSYEEVLLIPNLVKAVRRINGAYIGDKEANNAINELKATIPEHEGAKRIINFYRFGVPVKFDKEEVVKEVQFFDFENIENNEFIVSRQVNYQGKDKVRTDIMLYVNGIPLVNIECKNPGDKSDGWLNAYRQIKDYEKAVPELYSYIKLGICAEREARYFPIVPWLKKVKTHEWKRAGKDSIDSVIEMLSRDTLLDVIRSFLYTGCHYLLEESTVHQILTSPKGKDSLKKK